MALKLHDFNARWRSRWKKKKKRQDRGAREQRCLTFKTELASILKVWQGYTAFNTTWIWYLNCCEDFISILNMHDAFYPLPKQPTEQVHMCVVLDYPMQKSGGLRQKMPMGISWMWERKSIGPRKATVDTIQCFYNVINVKKQIPDWSDRCNTVWFKFLSTTAKL